MAVRAAPQHALVVRVLGEQVEDVVRGEGAEVRQLARRGQAELTVEALFFVVRLVLILILVVAVVVVVVTATAAAAAAAAAAHAAALVPLAELGEAELVVRRVAPQRSEGLLRGNLRDLRRRDAAHALERAGLRLVQHLEHGGQVRDHLRARDLAVAVGVVQRERRAHLLLAAAAAQHREPRDELGEVDDAVAVLVEHVEE